MFPKTQPLGFIAVLVFSFIFLTFFLPRWNIAHKKAEDGETNPSGVSNEVYEALEKFAKAESLPTLRSQSNVEKSAYVRYWRSKGDITVQKQKEKDIL